jgi:hypothetical protein
LFLIEGNARRIDQFMAFRFACRILRVPGFVVARFVLLLVVRDRGCAAGGQETVLFLPSYWTAAPPVWERHQFEHVSRKAIAAGEAAGTAIGTLVEIMSDSAVPIRQRRR